jgi:hypothetical protein
MSALPAVPVAMLLTVVSVWYAGCARATGARLDRRRVVRLLLAGAGAAVGVAAIGVLTVWAVYLVVDPRLRWSTPPGLPVLHGLTGQLVSWLPFPEPFRDGMRLQFSLEGRQFGGFLLGEAHCSPVTGRSNLSGATWKAAASSRGIDRLRYVQSLTCEGERCSAWRAVSTSTDRPVVPANFSCPSDMRAIEVGVHGGPEALTLVDGMIRCRASTRWVSDDGGLRRRRRCERSGPSTRLGSPSMHRPSPAPVPRYRLRR